MERDRFLRALVDAGWVQSVAARTLGLNQSTVSRRCTEMQLAPPGGWHRGAPRGPRYVREPICEAWVDGAWRRGRVVGILPAERPGKCGACRRNAAARVVVRIDGREPIEVHRVRPAMVRLR